LVVAVDQSNRDQRAVIPPILDNLSERCLQRIAYDLDAARLIVVDAPEIIERPRFIEKRGARRPAHATEREWSLKTVVPMSSQRATVTHLNFVIQQLPSLSGTDIQENGDGAEGANWRVRPARRNLVHSASGLLGDPANPFGR